MKSYPVVVLNVFWSLISILGYFGVKLESKKSFSPIVFNILITIVSVSMIILMNKNVDSLSFTTTFIYVAAYLLFSVSALSKLDYLLWCSIGFLLIFPHLIEKEQFAVSINEIYGFVIGIVGIIKIIKEKKKLKETTN